MVPRAVSAHIVLAFVNILGAAAAGVGLVWLLIAVLGDFVFIVKAFSPADGYYKLDVYVYYALTLAIPLAAGWRRTMSAR